MLICCVYYRTFTFCKKSTAQLFDSVWPTFCWTVWAVECQLINASLLSRTSWNCAMHCSSGPWQVESGHTLDKHQQRIVMGCMAVLQSPFFFSQNSAFSNNTGEWSQVHLFWRISTWRWMRRCLLIWAENIRRLEHLKIYTQCLTRCLIFDFKADKRGKEVVMDENGELKWSG